MKTRFILVHFDVECVRGIVEPKYRVFVNNELFTERSWIFKDNEYLEEMLQIEAQPGEYQIRHELVPPHLAQLRVENMRVDFGPGKIDEQGQLRIENAPV